MDIEVVLRETAAYFDALEEQAESKGQQPRSEETGFPNIPLISYEEDLEDAE